MEKLRYAATVHESTILRRIEDGDSDGFRKNGRETEEGRGGFRDTLERANDYF